MSTHPQSYFNHRNISTPNKEAIAVPMEPDNLFRISWLHAMDEHGETPMSRAVKCGHRGLLEIIVEQSDRDSDARPKNDTALQRAAAWGLLEIIRKKVTEQGADINERDDRGETPLHKASRMGQFNAVRELTRLGADLDAGDTLGLRPLHWAAVNGRQDIARLLLHHKANPNARERIAGGLTPLALAKLLGRDDFAECLAEYGGTW
jgi:ankyrin repeat protein